MTYSDFLTQISNPARQALLYAGITSFEILITYTEKEILALHGIGKATLPALYSALAANNLTMNRDSKSITST